MILFFILAVFSSARGLQVTIGQPTYEVARGDDVTLVCSFIPAAQPNPSTLVIITWSMEADSPVDPKIVIATFYSIKNQVDIKPSYKDRAEMTHDITGGRSTLTLRKVSMQDNRLWQCRVQIPGDEEGTPSTTTELVVLVAPSVPVVSVQGEAEYWNNINLTCVSEEGSPAPTYSWKTNDIRNTPRVFPPRTTEKNGVLSLFNISMETSGFFICTATNQVRSASSNFTLTVMPPSMKVGSTVAIIGGVVAGVLVLGIVIYCCRKKRNKSKQENVQGVPEVVKFHDTPTLNVGAGYRDDIPEDRTEGSIVLHDHYEMKGEMDHDDQSVRTDCSDGRKEKSDDNRNNYGDQRDRYGGSRDRLDDQRDRYGGSRDRLDDQRVRYGGSRDRLDDPPVRFSGSRDRLDDPPVRYGGSRDRLDDPPVVLHGGSRDLLDDPPVRYGGSRDRLDDPPVVRHGGSRDRLDDPPVVRHGGSRDRLDDPPVVRHGGSRDRLDDPPVRYGGSRDRLDDPPVVRHGGSRDRLDDPPVRHGGSRDRLNDQHDRYNDQYDES
ncbi:V-set and immunoglobulin domain-containing protein 1-like [Oncorhynchus keta]|uniref:V-set and immunoglobulin domain-containing protein 1-like n=1 Tax=Oncorhynchus keta TaxID=8018 RepID=UPI00227BE918|nr:V-set and immunoglobulin domain-containing protein 1-like [Oncorhynchus keta]